MAKHTPGPWRWEVSRTSQRVELCGGLPAGRFDKTVLSFARWGLNQAAPVFWFWQEGRSWSDEPKRADALAVAAPGREHHANWFAEINHPDAHLIAAAPDLLGALKAAEEYMAARTTECSEPYPLQRVRAAIAKAEGQQ